MLLCCPFLVILVFSSLHFVVAVANQADNANDDLTTRGSDETADILPAEFVSKNEVYEDVNNGNPDGMEPSQFLAMGLIVKNEADSIHRTIMSVVGVVSSIVLLDTGSSDDTVQIVTDICARYNVALFLNRTVFVDFSTTRNELISLMESVLPPHTFWALLLDANDVLHLPSRPRLLARFAPDSPLLHTLNPTGTTPCALLVTQQWRFSSSAPTRFRNLRLIRLHVGWHYERPVHEFLTRSGKEGVCDETGDGEDIVVYQDRRSGAESSEKRLQWDRRILEKEVQKDGGMDARNVFYLANTVRAIEDGCEDAMGWYDRRMVMDGFGEEAEESVLAAGECAAKVGQYARQAWYYMHLDSLGVRAEGDYRMGGLYHQMVVQDTDRDLTWSERREQLSFAEKATWRPFPRQVKLFVSQPVYDVFRWHSLANIIARWPGHVYDVHSLLVGAHAVKRGMVGLHGEAGESEHKDGDLAEMSRIENYFQTEILKLAPELSNALQTVEGIKAQLSVVSVGDVISLEMEATGRSLMVRETDGAVYVDTVTENHAKNATYFRVEEAKCDEIDETDEYCRCMEDETALSLFALKALSNDRYLSADPRYGSISADRPVSLAWERFAFAPILMQPPASTIDGNLVRIVVHTGALLRSTSMSSRRVTASPMHVLNMPSESTYFRVRWHRLEVQE